MDDESAFEPSVALKTRHCNYGGAARAALSQPRYGCANDVTATLLVTPSVAAVAAAGAPAAKE